MRECGDCQLCCRVMPVKDLGKKANERCKHQKFGKGCMVHNKPEMPRSCRLWNCRWLAGSIPDDLSRPDRSHYVIDIMPDYIILEQDGMKANMQVVQIWIDPKYPDAHRDPALRRWLAEIGKKEWTAALIRYNERDAMTLFPPAISDDGQWHEVGQSQIKKIEKEHSLQDVVTALSKPGGL